MSLGNTTETPNETSNSNADTGSNTNVQAENRPTVVWQGNNQRIVKKGGLLEAQIAQAPPEAQFSPEAHFSPEAPPEAQFPPEDQSTSFQRAHNDQARLILEAAVSRHFGQLGQQDTTTIWERNNQRIVKCGSTLQAQFARAWLSDLSWFFEPVFDDAALSILVSACSLPDCASSAEPASFVILWAETDFRVIRLPNGSIRAEKQYRSPAQIAPLPVWTYAERGEAAQRIRKVSANGNAFWAHATGINKLAW